MNKKYISFFTDGIISGIFLCIGCAVSISTDSKPLGAFLFSLGLFAIITFRLSLYTGKAGYIAVNPPIYIFEVILTFLGNVAGTCLGANALCLTRFSAFLSEKSTLILETKFTDKPLSMLILAIFCGMLMFTAVEGNKILSEKNNYMGALFITILPVMVFIICGFNHCIADMAYFFISGCTYPKKAFIYFTLVVLGNALGCMLLPMTKRISNI